jgi:hypothetical protein
MTLGTMKEENDCDGFHVFVGLHYWYCGFYAFWLKQVQYWKLTRPHKEVAQGWEIELCVCGDFILAPTSI